MPREGFKKIYRGVLKIFGKALKMENCPKIIMGVVVRKKKQFSESRFRILNKTLSVPRNTLDVHFGIILKSFHQRNACVVVNLPLRFESMV